MRPGVLGAAAVLLAAANPLAAQELSLRLGGVHARYSDTLSGSAGALAGRLAWETPNLGASLDGNYTRFTSGTWTTQVSGTALSVRSNRSGIGLGMRADVDGDYVTGGSWSGTAETGPLVALPTGRWLAAAGVTAGAVRRIDGSSDAKLGASIMARRDLGAWTVDAGLAGTRAGTTRFADATVGVDLRTAAFGIGALLGARAGDLSGDPWLQAQLDVRATPWATLEAAAGTYPRDLTGFTSGVFVSLGMRVGGVPGSSRRGGRTGIGRADPTRSARIEPLAAQETRVIFVLPDAAEVAIAGEWNAWTPVTLTPAGRGAWQAVLPLASGVYRFSLVVDGTRWVVPPGVPVVPDDFGGSVGLLIVGGTRR